MRQLKHIGIKGEGYFCIVKKYLDESSGNYLASKELKKTHYSRDDYRYRTLREINILEDLQGNKNIIELLSHGHDRENEKIWYLMPFADQNLYDYIKKNNNSLTQEERYDLAEQLISAIKFAHSKEILHRDISPNNVLVFNIDGNIVLKVSDFGLGKNEESLSHFTKSSISGYGQILYVSPEQKDSLKNASKQSDIYSLGKLIYFVFTGKDPESLIQFELSSLVSKAIEHDPRDRFDSLDELEKHFLSIKDLQLNQTIDIQYLTIKDVLESQNEIDWIKVHELLVIGNYDNHVYDYIDAVCDLLMKNNNLNDYYSKIGTAIKDFINTFIERLNDCYGTVGWPFRDMNRFGSVLVKMVKIIEQDEVRINAIKHLWKLAYVYDQWAVQSEIKEVLGKEYVGESIQTQLAEYIVQSEVSVSISDFSGINIPQILKIGIQKSNEIVEQKRIKKEEEEKAKIEAMKNIKWD